MRIINSTSVQLISDVIRKISNELIFVVALPTNQITMSQLNGLMASIELINCFKRLQIYCHLLLVINTKNIVNKDTNFKNGYTK